mmetsp:Transcript_28547/g.60861  ORF Transcript_28547/g.60861 Transcript_28547/m.60861 type:complete len:570 (-) Transcript_28547:194-1903(-)
MYKFHGLAHIPRNSPCIRLRIRCFVIQPLTQITAPLELHNDKVTSVFLKVINHWADVLMVQARHDEYFFEDGGVDGGFDFFAQDAFYGDLTSGGAVDSSADCGECSAFELLIQLINLPKLLPLTPLRKHGKHTPSHTPPHPITNPLHGILHIIPMFRRLGTAPPRNRMMNRVINHGKVHRIRLRTGSSIWSGEIFDIVVLRTGDTDGERKCLILAIAPNPSISCGNAAGRSTLAPTPAPDPRAAPSTLSGTSPSRIVRTPRGIIIISLILSRLLILIILHLDNNECIPNTPLGIETNIVNHVLIPLLGGFRQRRAHSVHRPPQQFQIRLDRHALLINPTNTNTIIIGTAQRTAPPQIATAGAGATTPTPDGRRTSRQGHFVRAEGAGGGRAETGEEGGVGGFVEIAEEAGGRGLEASLSAGGCCPANDTGSKDTSTTNTLNALRTAIPSRPSRRRARRDTCTTSPTAMPSMTTSPTTTTMLLLLLLLIFSTIRIIRPCAILRMGSRVGGRYGSIAHLVVMSAGAGMVTGAAATVARGTATVIGALCSAAVADFVQFLLGGACEFNHDGL